MLLSKLGRMALPKPVATIASIANAFSASRATRWSQLGPRPYAHDLPVQCGFLLPRKHDKSFFGKIAQGYPIRSGLGMIGGQHEHQPIPHDRHLLEAGQLDCLAPRQTDIELALPQAVEPLHRISMNQVEN